MAGSVARVSGPVVIAEGLVDAKMYDVVRVGSLGLVGEIIRLVGGTATVQVYEDTTGIRPGGPGRDHRTGAQRGAWTGAPQVDLRRRSASTRRHSEERGGLRHPRNLRSCSRRKSRLGVHRHREGRRRGNARNDLRHGARDPAHLAQDPRSAWGQRDPHRPQERKIYDPRPHRFAQDQRGHGSAHPHAQVGRSGFRARSPRNSPPTSRSSPASASSIRSTRSRKAEPRASRDPSGVESASGETPRSFWGQARSSVSRILCRSHDAPAKSQSMASKSG